MCRDHRKEQGLVWEHESIFGMACLEQLQKMGSEHVAVAGGKRTVSYHPAVVKTPGDHARVRQALTAQ